MELVLLQAELLQYSQVLEALDNRDVIVEELKLAQVDKLFEALDGAYSKVTQGHFLNLTFPVVLDACFGLIIILVGGLPVDLNVLLL